MQCLKNALQRRGNRSEKWNLIRLPEMLLATKMLRDFRIARYVTRHVTTCVAMKLRWKLRCKLRGKLHSVKAPLHINLFLPKLFFVKYVGKFLFGVG